MRIDSQRIDVITRGVGYQNGDDIKGDMYAKEAYSMQAEIIKDVLCDYIVKARDNTSLLAKLTGKNVVETAHIIRDLARAQNEKIDPFIKENYYSYVDKAISDLSKSDKVTIDYLSKYVDAAIRLSTSVNILSVNPTEVAYDKTLPVNSLARDYEQKISTVERGEKALDTFLTNSKVRQGAMAAGLAVAIAFSGNYVAGELQNRGLLANNPFASASLANTLAIGVRGTTYPTLRIQQEGSSVISYPLGDQATRSVFSYNANPNMSDGLLVSVDLVVDPTNNKILKSRLADINVMKIDIEGEINGLLKILLDNKAFNSDEKSMITDRLLKKDFAFFERLLSDASASGKSAFYADVVKLGNEIEASKAFAQKLEKILLTDFVNAHNRDIANFGDETIQIAYGSYLEKVRTEMRKVDRATTFEGLNEGLMKVEAALANKNALENSVRFDSASMRNLDGTTIQAYLDTLYDNKDKEKFIDDIAEAKRIASTLGM